MRIPGSLALGLLAFCLMSMSTIGISTPAFAEEPVRVIEASQENLFPDAIVFHLRAEATEAIAQATLQYKVGDRAITNYSPAKVTPSKSIDVKHRLDLRRYYQPPGVAIRFRWQLRTSTGQETLTEWTRFTLDDPRFSWKSVRSGNLEIGWYSGDNGFGRTLLESGVKALAKLREEAGVETDQQIRILIYGSQADFQSASPPGGQEWAGGRAFSREAIVLIAASPSNLDYARRTVPHELSHVVVYQATRNPYGSLPTWLEEGLAMVAEGDQQPASFARTLRKAIADDKLISVWSLSSSFPTDASLAELSYAQSESIVRFVIGRYGRAGISSLMARFREGSTYDDALIQVLGIDTYGLDEAWRSSIGARPLSPAPPASTEVKVNPTSRQSPTTVSTAVAPVPATQVSLPTPDSSPPSQPTPSGSTEAARCALPPVAGVALLGAIKLGGLSRKRFSRRHGRDNEI